MRNFEESKLRL